MNKKGFFLLACLSAAAAMNAAEKTYYQICRVEPLSENIKIVDEMVLYEDANCKIYYDFWSNKGDAGFTFENKTNGFITIDLTKTFFVQNGYSYPYFLNRVSCSSSSGNIATVDKGQENLAGVANAMLLAIDIASASMGGSVYSRTPITAPQNITTETSSVSYYERRTAVVPAKCKVNINEYIIKDKVFRDCSVELYPNKKEITTTPYSKENTPMWFGNLITYRLDGGDDTIVENYFYVKSITNKPENIVLEFTNKQSLCQDKKRWVFIESYSDGFYIQYTSN